jgi:hypothetical protein
MPCPLGGTPPARDGGIDEAITSLAAVLVAAQDDRLHVQRDEARIVETDCDLSGDGLGPGGRIEPDARTAEARGRSGGNGVRRRQVLERGRGDREQAGHGDSDSSVLASPS